MKRLAPLVLATGLLASSSPATARSWWRRPDKRPVTPVETLRKLTRSAQDAISYAQRSDAFLARMARVRGNATALHRQLDNMRRVETFNHAAQKVAHAVGFARQHGLASGDTLRILGKLVADARALGGPSKHKLYRGVASDIATDLYVVPLVEKGAQHERTLHTLSQQLTATARP